MRRILLTPGPITTSRAVKSASNVDICPREKEFEKVIKSIREDLVRLAGGDSTYTCVPFASSGTGAMEACVGSIVPNDESSNALKKGNFIFSNGIYGHRFEVISGILDIDGSGISYPWNNPINNTVEKFINEPYFGAVFMTHHETTTGILNDIRMVSKYTKKYNKLLIVDAISSFGAVPIDVKKDNIDFLISTSNKCIQGLPGISFIICKRDFLEGDIGKTTKSHYFDLGAQYRFFEEHGQFRFTAPVQAVCALRKALDELIEETLKVRYERYQHNYCTLVTGMHERGFLSFLSKEIPRSFLIETFYQPKGFNLRDFHNKLGKQGFVIYPSALIEDTFRLGCFGDINKNDITNFLEAVDKIWSG